MNCIGEKNIFVVQERFPRLTAQWQDTTHAPYGTCHFEVSDSGDVSGHVVTSTGIVRLVSQHAPARNGERFARGIYDDSVDVFVCVGLALGYNVNALRAIMNQHQRIVVIEPSWELFLAQVHHIDLLDFFQDERVHLLVDEDAEHCMMNLRPLLWSMHGARLAYICTPSYQNLFPQYVERMCAGMAQEQKALIEEKQLFIASCQDIRDTYFNENKQMGNLMDFFDRIGTKQEQRKLTHIELCYLFIKTLFFQKSYTESTCA